MRRPPGLSAKGETVASAAPLTRRHWLRAMVAGSAGGAGALPALVGMLGLGAWTPARAGQAEEPLADSVRTAMSRAVADSGPPDLEFGSIEERLAFLRWLGAMSPKLASRKPDFEVRRAFLETVWYEARRAGLEPALVLGLIQVESAFRKYAISRVGARGYMQVMPFWARLIGDGEPARLFHMQTNLRFGCVILRHYLDREKGDLFLALGRYNGSRGRAEYPNLVMGARRSWVHAETPPGSRYSETRSAKGAAG